MDVGNEQCIHNVGREISWKAVTCMTVKEMDGRIKIVIRETDCEHENRPEQCQNHAFCNQRLCYHSYHNALMKKEVCCPTGCICFPCRKAEVREETLISTVVIVGNPKQHSLPAHFAHAYNTCLGRKYYFIDNFTIFPRYFMNICLKLRGQTLLAHSTGHLMQRKSYKQLFD
jgi:hypothetical protein